MHERLLFKTSWHSHFQWNLAGSTQYLIQKFLRNEGLLQASLTWLGLAFAFSHIPPTEVKGWQQGAQLLCLFLWLSDTSSQQHLFLCCLQKQLLVKGGIRRIWNSKISPAFWEGKKQCCQRKMPWKSQRTKRSRELGCLRCMMGNVQSCINTSFNVWYLMALEQEVYLTGKKEFPLFQ